MGEDGESREDERDREGGNSERDVNGASGVDSASDAIGVNDKNAAALYSLDRAIRGGRGGFYFLIASPRTQTETIKRYAGENIGVYNFSGENRELVEISNLLDREPGRRAYVFLNFQLALQKKDKTPVSQDGKIDIWNIDAVRRLNFSRNGLAKRGRTLIFCMTQEVDDLLNRRAYDFYDYVKLFFHLEDHADMADRTVQTAHIEDRSIGVDVKIDFSLPEEELLALAVTLGNQANELYQKARYADALHLYEKQRKIREQVLGKDHPDTATAYNNIGVLYREQGDYARALEWCQKALRIREKVLGSDHPDTAAVYNNIGVVYTSQEDYARALEWYQKALRICEKVLGSEHPNTAASYNNIGYIYRAQGDYARALEWHQKALRIWEKVLGSGHPNTARSYNNIGYIYRAQGDYARALEWYQKALRIFESVLGKDHPDTAMTYHNIGTLYFDQGDYKEALEWLKKAQAIRLKILGAEHPSTKDTQEWIDDTERLQKQNGGTEHETGN